MNKALANPSTLATATSRSKGDSSHIRNSILGNTIWDIVAYNGLCRYCDCPRFVTPQDAGNTCARSTCGHNYHVHDLS
jgi:hypothetical protein